ncbi:protein YgfX [Methylomonas albis]|uniref:protein YgfX n=1 Tax=Methylomonas albis TaxID=1854563 RepID=UPI00389952DF
MNFTIGRSRLLTFIVSAIHVLVILACWLNALPMPYKCLLTMLVLLSWRSNTMSGEISVVYLRYTPNHGWSLLSNGDQYQLVDIQASTVVSRFLIALHWVHNKGRRQSMIIPKDAISSNDYRKLSVCLIISGHGPG